MRKLFTILSLALLSTSLVFAQEAETLPMDESSQPVKQVRPVRYRGDLGLQLGIFATTFKGDTNPYWYGGGAVINTTHGIELNEAATLALGIAGGVAIVTNGENGVFSPVFSGYLHFDYAFLQGRPVRPWVGARVGYGMCSGASGPDAGLGVGVRINDSWDISVWYRQLVGIDEGHLYLSCVPHFGFAWRFPSYRAR